MSLKSTEKTYVDEIEINSSTLISSPQMGPLQLNGHLAGTLMTHWDKKNKEMSSPKTLIFFRFEVPQRHFRPSKVFW